jgi:hypothetical protein
MASTGPVAKRAKRFILVHEFLSMSSAEWVQKRERNHGQSGDITSLTFTAPGALFKAHCGSQAPWVHPRRANHWPQLDNTAPRFMNSRRRAAKPYNPLLFLGHLKGHILKRCYAKGWRFSRTTSSMGLLWTQRASSGSTHKRTEGRAPVWGSEFTSKDATL